MIALILAGDLPHDPLFRRFRHRRRSVDGPFHVFTGMDEEGNDWFLVRADDAQDPCHGAARLAAQRGARLVVHLGPARWTVPPAEEEVTDSPVIVSSGRVVDASALEEVQGLMSDLAEEIPDPLQEMGPCVWEEEEGEGLCVASFRIPLTVPFLARQLHDKFGASLADLGAAGSAAGAAESEIDFRALHLAEGLVQPRWIRRQGGFAREQQIANTMARFLDEQAWFEPQGRRGR